MSRAFINIYKNMEIITNINPDIQLNAEKNQNINKCQNSLDDFVKVYQKIKLLTFYYLYF